MKIRKYIRENFQRLFEAESSNNIIKGLDILNYPPFSELPDTRMQVDWNNRGDASLPSIEGFGRAEIFSKDDIIGAEPWTHPKSKQTFTYSGYVENFKKKYGEEPMFVMGPNNSFDVINEPYKQNEKTQHDAISQYGTEGD